MLGMYFSFFFFAIGVGLAKNEAGGLLIIVSHSIDYLVRILGLSPQEAKSLIGTAPGTN